MPARAETGTGGRVERHNRGVIQICQTGGAGSAATDAFERYFTAAQDRALRSLIEGVRARTAITRITGHNDHAAKACPGFVVRNWIN
jgi:hypothetical protein